MHEHTTNPDMPGMHHLTAPPPARSAADVAAFAWDASDGQGRRVCGITDRREVAIQQLRRTLDGMTQPGASGMVRPARLDTLAAGGPAYIYGQPVLRGHRDAHSGTLVFDGPPALDGRGEQDRE